MMLIPKWGNYPGDGGGGITLVIDKQCPQAPGCALILFSCQRCHRERYDRRYYGRHHQLYWLLHDYIPLLYLPEE